MKYSIIVEPSAENDLLEALYYIEFTLMNPDAAERLLDLFEEKVSSLEDMPDRFSLPQDPFFIAWNIRYISCSNYLAFYVINENTHTVHIIRFLYNKRNWRTILTGKQ